MNTAVTTPVRRSDQIAPASQVTPQTNQVTPQTGQVAPAVGAGVTGATSGDTPPPSGAAVDIGTAFASLFKIMPELKGVDPAVAVAMAMAKMLAVQGTSANEQIK